MRVIAGTAKGMKLKAPKGTAVRPTADRVKEALFSIIGTSIQQKVFVDLYAGSGAIGIEALSRGSGYCVFIDHKKDNIALIKENLEKTRLAEKARLIVSDAEKAVVKLAREDFKAGLIYLDPPYSDTDFLPLILNIFNHQMIHSNGLLIIEHDYHNRQRFNEFANIRQKRYGDTCLTFISPPRQ